MFAKVFESGVELDETTKRQGRTKEAIHLTAICVIGLLVWRRGKSNMTERNKFNVPQDDRQRVSCLSACQGESSRGPRSSGKRKPRSIPTQLDSLPVLCYNRLGDQTNDSKRLINRARPKYLNTFEAWKKVEKLIESERIEWFAWRVWWGSVNTRLTNSRRATWIREKRVNCNY
jgi:hypothetical protein